MESSLVCKTFSSLIYKSTNGIIKISNSNDIASLSHESELQHLASLHLITPKILHFPSNEQPYIEMEYIDGLTWNKYLRSFYEKDTFESIDITKNKLKTFCEFFYTLKYYNDILHYQFGITHNDIHADNILLNKDQTKIYYIDFGCAERFDLAKLSENSQIIKNDDDNLFGMLFNYILDCTNIIDISLSNTLFNMCYYDKFNEHFDYIFISILHCITKKNIHIGMFLILLLLICRHEKNNSLSSDQQYSQTLNRNYDHTMIELWNVFLTNIDQLK